MKNIIIIILVSALLVLGFLFFTQKKSNVSYEPWPETEPATVRPTTINNYPVQNNPTTATNTNNNSSSQQQENHEYQNNEYDFYVDLSNRVITQRTAIGSTYKIIYFDKANGERDFIVSVFTQAEWQQYWNSLRTTFNDHRGQVVIDGVTFDYYVKPAVDPGIDDPQTLHYYIAQHGGLYYQIYTTNTANINSFGFI